MKLHITHTNTYTYDAPVPYGLQQVRLTPITTKHQTVLDWTVDIVGGTQEVSFDDQYQNKTLLVLADRGTSEVTVTVSGTVETHTSDGIFGKIYGTAPLWHFLQSTPRTKPGKGIQKLAKGIARQTSTLDALHDLSKAILEVVPYGQATTFAGTTAEESLSVGGGVCQDHAQIFVSAARVAGIPARYVSGYLMMNDRIDQDASHAWAEAHIDGLGWVGFDVSNGYSPDERYVRIATGRDSSDASPISGMRLGTTAESMIVSLQVQQ
ncbi:transglutaminase family protein [Pacificibacter marinus]|uniref:Transglutaminase-like superfamily protein n=1 Tax=Pacificibacter marinus TaxID=658057 RepID=A0A1Y5TA37_9RHOB|nr:transglutaminase family protein [Pacificibacter marinus]SEL09852.1 Transglutaminase-like enzyme, putative cysteine protease [Pacificibacter marinus]SLN59403.1 Transglutaminase-like superfamily protein [Pacificibacter marinus]